MTNKIYQLSDSEFIDLVKSSLNISEVLFKLGYTTKDNSWGYSQVKQRMDDLHLNGYNFRGKQNLKQEKTSIDANKLFSSNSKHSRTVLRRYVLKHSLLPYKCSICGIKEWNNKTISLELDHINGVNNDNRLVNLRFLCPNCHSQTSTYGSRNIQTHYEVSENLENLILSNYRKIKNKKKVSQILDIPLKIINQILCKNGISKPNQKYVIQYDNSHKEVQRFGTITECCEWLIDNNFVKTKLIKTCRNTLKNNIGKLFNNYYFEILDA